MKSSSSVGPRRPALSEFWLSAIGTPWLVVSARPLESTRTRSSGPLPGLMPGSAAASDFLRCIALGQRARADARIGRLDRLPCCRRRRASPNSLGFAALNGNASASASVPPSSPLRHCATGPSGAAMGRSWSCEPTSSRLLALNRGPSVPSKRCAGRGCRSVAVFVCWP